MNKDNKIGLVKVSTVKDITVTPEYSDGDVENEILEIYKKGLTDKRRNEILNNNPSWPIRYHLAYERGNILNWYNFKKDARVLEVGSGCGAVTEVLVKNNISVVANELSERRATINAYRNKNADNLEIVIGNLQDYNPKEKFDYVVCIGVLEYAGTFIVSDKPYEEFLHLLKRFLKPNGTILLAIENKLGFKYLAGAREDHTGGFFDGINNYPQKKPIVRTFGRDELVSLFNKSDLEVNKFYYPFPDYKLPKVVYSDEYLPNSKNANMPKGLLPSPNFDQPREFLFNEQLFAYAIENNNLFGAMANSFLVEASVGDKAPMIQNDIFFSINSENRLPQFRIQTKLVKDDTKVVFQKKASTASAITHVNNMKLTHDILKEHLVGQGCDDMLGVAPIVNFNKKEGIVEFKEIDGKGADRILLDAVLSDDQKLVDKILDNYEKVLSFLSVRNKKTLKAKLNNVFKNKLTSAFDDSSLMVGGLVDYNLDNFIIDTRTGKWWLIDYEWGLNEPILTEYVYNRSLMYFCWMNKNMILSRLRRQTVHSNNYWAIPEALYVRHKNISSIFNKVFNIERDFLQPYVTGSHSSRVNPTKLIKMTDDDAEPYFIDRVKNQIQDKENQIQDKENQIQELKVKLEDITKERDSIINSKTYRAGLLIAKPYKRIGNLRRRIKQS